MRMDTRTILSRTFVVAGLAAAALAWGATSARADEWNKTYPISGRAQVRVETNDSNVTVYTGDQKQVGVHVETTGLRISERDVRVNVRQDGDRIDIDVKVPNHWCVFCVNIHRGLKIEVHMPREGDLTVTTGDGHVEVDPLNGNMDIHTGDGHIAVRGAKGDIRLRTGDGHIEARDLDGKLDASSGDGHIRIDGRFDVLNLKTGDGSIEARVATGSKMSGSWTIHTGDGSIYLTLPDGFQANLDARTNDGRISLGFPVTVDGIISKSEVRGKINGGGGILTLRTGDGSIRLMRS